MGGELQRLPATSRTNEPTVAWDDIDSAFEIRIQSRIITNLDYIDLSSFITDAKKLFIEKLTSLLNEHQAVKVSAELAAEFEIQKSGEPQVDNNAIISIK